MRNNTSFKHGLHIHVMDLKKKQRKIAYAVTSNKLNKNNITLSMRDIHEYQYKKLVSSHPLIFNKSYSSVMNLYWKMKLNTFIYAFSKMQVLLFIVYMPSSNHVTDLKQKEI